MLKHLRLFSFLFLAWAMGSVASASTTTPLVSQENYTVGQGDIETLFSIDPTLLRGDIHGNGIHLALGANYFLTDMLAPGVEFDLDHATGLGTTAQFLPNIKAYFPTNSRILPYAQLGFGYAHIPGNDLFDIRIGPGINFLLANNVAVGFQFRYDIGVGDATVHKLEFPLGFVIYFKV